MSALIAHYDNPTFWIPATTKKDDLECPIHLKVRLVYGTLDVRLLRVSHSTMHISILCSQRGRREWAEGPSPPPCGPLTCCFSAVAELLVTTAQPLIYVWSLLSSGQDWADMNGESANWAYNNNSLNKLRVNVCAVLSCFAYVQFKHLLTTYSTGPIILLKWWKILTCSTGLGLGLGRGLGLALYMP